MRSTYVYGMSSVLALSLCAMGCGVGTPSKSISESQPRRPDATAAKIEAPAMHLASAPRAAFAAPMATFNETLPPPAAETEAYDHVAESPLLAVKDRPRDHQNQERLELTA